MRFLVAKHHLHGSSDRKIKITDNSGFGRDALIFLKSVRTPKVTFGQESAGKAQMYFGAVPFRTEMAVRHIAELSEIPGVY